MKWSSPLSDGDLLKYSADHVAYEVEMFFTVGQSVLHNAWATPNDRALLESFIVHLRSLMDFLYPTSGLKPTDIIAAYYFKEKSSWQATRPSPHASLLKARDRAHKQLVHLTTGRVTGDPQWKIRDLLLAMRPPLVTFTTAASPGLLDPAVERAIPPARALSQMPVFSTSTSTPVVIRVSPPAPAPTFGDECDASQRPGMM